jgi:oligopeptide/dipeptide ABC transporter ATP-binding protein
MRPLLRVEHLDVTLRTEQGAARVLRDVNISVGGHQRVGLVGESGCGKSLTLRAIMGILRTPPATISAGRIWFDDQDTLVLPDAERDALRGRALAMVFQDPMTALNPVFTVATQMLDVLRWGDARAGTRRSNAARRAVAREALRKVRLADPDRVLRGYPHMLSGGMRQRVLIAMALLNAPRLLLADEPGTALDVTTQDEVLRLLDDLVRGGGLAFLLVTHNLGVVRGMTDRVYVMYSGTVVEEAPTAAIFAEPLHPYTRALFECVPKLTAGALPRGIDGVVPDYLAPPPGCRFAPRCPSRMAMCDTPVPRIPVGADRQVACWLYREAA